MDKTLHILAIIKGLRPPYFIRTPFLLCYLLTLSSYLLVLVFYFRLQPVVPLFYSLAQDSQQLAHKNWIFLFPAMLTGITLGHLSLAHAFRTYDRLLLQLFSWTTLAVEVILMAAIIRIIAIVS